MNSSKLVAALVAVASITSTSANATAQQLDAASASGSGAIPPCNQTELVELGKILKTNTRKQQCQTVLKIKEMLDPEAEGFDFKILCDQAACTAALNILYNTLPQCAYQDWSPQNQAEKVLKFCGITPTNTTVADDGSASLSGSTGDSSSPGASWGSTGGSSTGDDFAPIGSTASPVVATPTPTTTTSMAAIAPLTSALVVATSLLASVLFA